MSSKKHIQKIQYIENLKKHHAWQFQVKY